MYVYVYASSYTYAYTHTYVITDTDTDTYIVLAHYIYGFYGVISIINHLKWRISEVLKYLGSEIPNN